MINYRQMAKTNSDKKPQVKNNLSIAERQKLVESVIYMAKKMAWDMAKYRIRFFHASRHRHGQVYSDMLSESYLAICRAAEYFDPDRDNGKGGKIKFTTFASRAIFWACRDYDIESKEQTVSIDSDPQYVANRGSRSTMKSDFTDQLAYADSGQSSIDASDAIDYMVGDIEDERIPDCLRKLSEGWRQYELAVLHGVSRQRIEQMVNNTRRRLAKAHPELA